MKSSFEIDRPRGSWRSLTLSLTLHSVVLTLLLLAWKPEVFSTKSDTLRTVDLVLADVSSTNATQYLEQFPAKDSSPELAASELRDMLPLSQPSPTQASADVAASASANPAAPNLDAGTMAQPTGNSGLKIGGGQLSADELKEIAAERARLEGMAPKGDPATIRVFGSGGLSGRKFVFVIDRSKSMGSEGLGVLERANAELQAALAQLTPDHQFQVVAYHHETQTIDGRALLSATAENRRKVVEFIQNLAAFGGTDHESGLIAAIALKPDIIVLLTDGGLPEMTAPQLATIRRMSGKNTQIHCIQFGNGSTPSTSFMTTLAAENRGTYKYVDVSAWN